MVDHLLVTIEHCKGATFSNPITKGAEKVACGIIEKHINSTKESETVTETAPESDEMDVHMNYMILIKSEPFTHIQIT